MEDAFIPYAAGLLDGEGSVAITRTTPQHANSTSPLPRYRMHVIVHMVDAEVLYLLQARWGGTVNPHKPSGPRDRDSYQWNIQALKARQFLADLLPYLIIKRERAALAIEFQDHLTASGAQRFQGQGMKRHTEEIVKVRDHYHARMKVLNQRGRIIV